MRDNLPFYGAMFATAVYTIFCAGAALKNGDWSIAIDKYWPMVLLWCPSPHQAVEMIKNKGS